MCDEKNRQRLTKQKKGGQVGNSCTVSRYWMDLGHRVNHYTYII